MHLAESSVVNKEKVSSVMNSWAVIPQFWYFLQVQLTSYSCQYTCGLNLLDGILWFTSLQLPHDCDMVYISAQKLADSSIPIVLWVGPVSSQNMYSDSMSKTKEQALYHTAFICLTKQPWGQKENIDHKENNGPL